MKLINPAGRKISTFDTQANATCGCICSYGSPYSYNSAYTLSISSGGYCAANCGYGQENLAANANKATAKI